MDNIILITGTRKGIGKQLAEYYLKNGYIVSGCSREKGTIEHPKYKHFELDVRNEKKVIHMVRTIKKEYGRIDILLNNAGIAAMNHILTTPLESAQSVFNTNFMGTFIFSREVSKVMMKQKKGKIINFTTVAVPLKIEGEAVYSASKSAIENFTKTSAKELADFGITVNAIGPTPIPSDLIKNIPEEKLDQLLNQQAIKRYGSIEDVINVINFFIDEKSSFVTGQIVYLGGV